MCLGGFGKWHASVLQRALRRIGRVGFINPRCIRGMHQMAGLVSTALRGLIKPTHPQMRYFVLGNKAS